MEREREKEGESRMAAISREDANPRDPRPRATRMVRGEEGKRESFKFNAVRFISGCGLLGGRNDLIRACARRQAALPSQGNSISLRR